MPTEYQEMKASAIASFKRQWRDLNQSSSIDHKVRVYMIFRGKHSRSSDYVDNVPGTLYDALTQAQILRSDNGLWSPGGIHDLDHSSKQSPRVDVFIAPWLPFLDSIGQISEIIDFLKSA
jgi:Holliday junction resolvase RusA-like endonuclease